MADIFDMSDEEIAALDAGTPVEQTKTEETKQEPAVEETKLEESNEDQSKTEQEPEAKSATEENAEGNKAEDTGSTKVEEPKQEEKAVEEVKPDDKQKEADKPKQDEKPSAQAQLDALFAPIKANGRETTIQSIDQARQLISMGLGFNKKMGEAKNALKIERMLQNNKIDEDSLNFLIDVFNKKPEAISKLVQDSGLDALELDAEKAGKYTPSNHKVSDKEFNIDEVLKELKDSPTVNRTLDVVTKDWDKASREAISEEPEVLKVIDAHMQNGVFDLISAQLDLDYATGLHKGLSNIQAYHQVGDAMHKAGKFAHLFGRSEQSQQASKSEPVVVQPNVKKAEDDEQRAARRKAASGNPPAAVSSAKPVNTKSILEMSDEEFLKL